jgi:prevent-host-death family protein
MEFEMYKHYSIAQAKDRLSHVVHEVEEGEPVELTRRGRTVAVMLSSDEYQRIQRDLAHRRDPWSILERWREETGGVDLTDEEIDSWRDRSRPRDFEWPE